MYKNDCSVIHETIIKDIVDVLTDIKDIDEVEFELGKNKAIKSIASATDALTLVFPVVVSSDMEITSAMMISKAIERKCVAMLQMLFSAFTIADAKDAVDYISRFHKNMSMTGTMDYDKFVDYVDDFVRKLDENSPITVDYSRYEAIREDMKRNMDYYLSMDCINETSIGDYSILPRTINGSTIVIKEADTKDPKDKRIEDLMDDLQKAQRDAMNMTRDVMGHAANIMRSASDRTITRNLNTTQNIIRRELRIDDVSTQRKNIYDALSKQVLSTSDIKKANELMPTTMIINFITPGENGADAIQTYAVIGVKAKMYPVTSMDIVDRIKAKNRDNNGFNNFIRATTREISFWKDFVFAVDKAKLDALSSSRRGSSSPIWKLLERRALKSRIRRNFRMANDATAITTLVMSQNEVDWLMKNENIDMTNPRTANSIMESFNLLGISIVDESIEVARFIFDTGDDDYESLTFSALERESSDNTYKRVVNLMTKMGR